MKSYYREYLPLRLGANEYSGYQIDAAQIVTIGKGLCYKLEFLEKSIPTNVDESFTFTMQASSLQGVDKLKSFHLMIASNNTWQGLVYASWPNDKIPPVVTKDVVLGDSVRVQIFLKENLWNYQNGEKDFNLCMSRSEGNHCKSIFDVRTFKNDSR